MELMGNLRNPLSSILVFLPMEWGEFCSRVAPCRLSKSVDDEWDDYHYDTSDNQHRIPYDVATCCDLARRNEAEDEGEEGAGKTNNSKYPHKCVAFTQSERTRAVLHPVSECYRSGEHHHVHYQIKQDREL